MKNTQNTPEKKPSSIADLPPCGRRAIAVNANEVQIYCRPPKRPPELTDAEAVADPKRWFAKQLVTCGTCLACTMRGEGKERPTNTTNIAKPVYMDAGLFPDLTKQSSRIREVAPRSEKVKPVIAEDGSTITYARDGWEPPPPIPGYRRVSDDLTNDGAWSFIRNSPPCKCLKLMEIEKPSCGCTRVLPTCTLRGKLLNIKPNQCETCPDQKPL